MKARRCIFPLLCSLLALGACKPIDTSNHLTKVEIPYVEQGALVEITANNLYDLVIKKTSNLICLYSVDLCAGCMEAKQQMEAYAKKQHCFVYLIDMTHISKKDYDILYDITGYINDFYQFGAWADGIEVALPRMDIFANQGVVVSFNDLFVNNALKYTTVTSAS